MKSINVSEAKARFSALVEEVEKGEIVTLCKRNVPVARIVPSRAPEGELRHKTRIGWAKGKVQAHGDLTEPAIADDAWEMHQ